MSQECFHPLQVNPKVLPSHPQLRLRPNLGLPRPVLKYFHLMYLVLYGIYWTDYEISHCWASRYIVAGFLNHLKPSFSFCYVLGWSVMITADFLTACKCSLWKLTTSPYCCVRPMRPYSNLSHNRVLTVFLHCIWCVAALRWHILRTVKCNVKILTRKAKDNDWIVRIGRWTNSMVLVFSALCITESKRIKALIGKNMIRFLNLRYA